MTTALVRAATQPDGLPERSPRALPLALALGGLTVVLDTTITIVALPALVRAFDVSLETIQWVTTAYILGLVATMPLSSALAGRVGRRRLYVTGLLVFAAASAAAGASSNVGELIAARVLQGLGGGVINPLGMAIGFDATRKEHRGRTAAILGLPVLVGPLVGPALAGWLITALSWRAIFYVTVLPALVGAVLVWRLTAGHPDTRRSGRHGRIDTPAAFLLVAGAALAVFGFGQANATLLWRAGTVGAGGAMLAAFAQRSWNAPSPLLKIRLLQDARFRRYLLVVAPFATAYFGSMLLTPTYVQITRGASALTAGSLAIPSGLATGLSLQLATRLTDRFPARRVVTAGLSIAAAASAAGILVLRPDTPFWVLAALGALMGTGAGAVLMPATTAATRHLAGSDLGSGSAILSSSTQLMSAIGTALITALFTAMVTLQVPSLHGGIGAASHLSNPGLEAVVPGLVTAQRLTQLGTLTLILVALALSRRLPEPDRPLHAAAKEKHG